MKLFGVGSFCLLELGMFASVRKSLEAIYCYPLIFSRFDSGVLLKNLNFELHMDFENSG